MKLVKELPDVRSLARTHVADLDVKSAYPHGQLIMNMSKETTKRELCRVKGVSEHMQRMQGINLLASHVNAYEFCVSMLGAPKYDDLLADFEKGGNGGTTNELVT